MVRWKTQSPPANSLWHKVPEQNFQFSSAGRRVREVHSLDLSRKHFNCNYRNKYRQPTTAARQSIESKHNKLLRHCCNKQNCRCRTIGRQLYRAACSCSPWSNCNTNKSMATRWRETADWFDIIVERLVACVEYSRLVLWWLVSSWAAFALIFASWAEWSAVSLFSSITDRCRSIDKDTSMHEEFCRTDNRREALPWVAARQTYWTR